MVSVWEQRKFSDFTWDAGKRNKDNLDLVPYAITNEHGFIPQNEAHDEFGYMKDTDRRAYNIVEPKSFAYNPARINVGSLGYYEGSEDVIVSSLYEVFKTAEYVDDRFLWHWLKSPELPKWIGKLQEGSVRLYFYYDKLCECILRMPSIDEQRKIAKYLDNLDHLITLHQRKILYGHEKVALVWEQRKLGEIYGLIGNAFVGTATPYYVEQGHFYLESNNVKDGQINYNSEIFINDEFYEKQKDKWLHTGDMVMVQSGHVGHAAVIPEELDNTAAHALIMFRNPKEEIEPYFLNYEYQTDKAKKKIENITTGNTIKHILASDMQEFVVDVPKYEEQKVIAGYFRNLDNLITLHQRKAICTKNVKNNHILSIFLWERAVFMGKMILYHGSPNKMIHPIYGLGEDKHDYGRGFYLTANIELAKEWAVCRPDQSNGWVHKYELVTDDLRILDFQQLNVLSWLAELMKHREASDSKRYRMLAAKFIDKYGIDTDGYDVIKGWRADASYFYIAKAFVRDEIDVDILEKLLFLGDLGIQYCIKSGKGYANLHELESELLPVSFADFNDKYNERDIAARENMRKLIDSDANKVTKVFSTLI